MTVDSKGYQYVYDYENRVVSISKLWGETEVPVADYVYDALGRRIQRTVYWEGSLIYTDRFYYNDAWQYLMKETDWPGDDMVYLNFVYGNYIDEVLLCQYGTETWRSYYLHDHLYSPAAAIDSSGTILERYEYDVYGAQRVFDNSWQTRTHSWYGSEFGLTGREVDNLDWDANAAPRLQHMHYRYRDYSPFMGRFLQHDPLGIRPTDMNYENDGMIIDEDALLSKIFYPLGQYNNGLNIYEYVKNNPVRYIDPLGLSSTECEINYLKCLMDAKDARSACAKRGWVACGLLCLGAPEGYPVCVILCRLAYEVVCDMEYDKAVAKCDAAKATNCCK